MQLDHERLDVYDLALEFLVFSNGIIEGYVTARGSATESAALLDVCQRLKLLDNAAHRSAKGMVVRIVSMLIKLAQSCEE
jgi:hypothetical protein